MPMFISLNASLLGSLLSPLLDAQDDLSGLPYAIQDLGLAYPTAAAKFTPHTECIEQTGNMLIMAYAHARFSGDGSLIHQHYNLTKRWADYLVANALTPNEQVSADEGSANQTNLALKGIVGIKTMAEISRALGQQFDAQQYDVHAAALIESWQSLALSTNKTAHVRGIYADAQSWVLLYNLYADRLLGTGLLSTSIQQEQTIFYKSLINPAFPYGVAVDSELQDWGSASSMLFTAATALDDDVRDSLITGVWNRAAMTLVPGPFPGDHDVFSGQILDCAGGPAAGAMFSLLSLNVPNVTIVVPQPAVTQSTSPLPSASPSPSPENDAPKATTSPGPIVGGVIGGLAFLSIAVGGFLLLRKRRHNKLPDGEGSMDMVEEQEGLTPFTLFPRESPVLIIERSSEASASKSLAPLQPDDSVAGPSSHEPTLTADAPTQKRPLPARPGGLSGAAPSPEGNSSLPVVPLSPGSRFGRSPTGEMMLLPRADVLHMQAEMDELREEMRQIIEERLEPPPEYTSTFGS